MILTVFQGWNIKVKITKKTISSVLKSINKTKTTKTAKVLKVNTKMNI